MRRVSRKVGKSGKKVFHGTKSQKEWKGIVLKILERRVSLEMERTPPPDTGEKERENRW